MEIVYHIGIHCTDEDRLIKSVLKNTGNFSSDGVKIPSPNKYRRAIRETIQELNGAPPEPGMREELLNGILDGSDAKRLVMSNPNFICVPNRVFGRNVFYTQTEPKIRALHQIFPEDQIEIFMSLRNPATYLPALFAESDLSDYTAFMKNMHVTDILWSNIIRRILHVAPKSRLVVWCNEDTPLIWAELIRKLGGVAPDREIAGGFDLLGTIMSPLGLDRFQAYMRQNPPKTEAQTRKVLVAFLEKFAIPEQIEEEVDFPNATPALVQELTNKYDEDVALIAGLPGVEFIKP
jgi:hypothetical protein